MRQLLLVRHAVGLGYGAAQVTGLCRQESRNQIPLPASPSLPISFGDLIQVSVFDSPDLSGPLRVDSKGKR